MLGIVMIGLEGEQITDREARRLKHPMAGGVLLLSHNCKDKQKLMHLTAQVRQINPDLIIAIDQEGGRVQRLKEGYTKLPAMGMLGKIYQTDKPAALQYARDCAAVIAFELRQVGITLSFAPVLDLARGNAAIGDRSFSEHPEVVTELATQLIDSLQKNGMVAVGKHFPGHGSTKQDTHYHTVYDRRLHDDIEVNDMQPFINLIGAQKLYAVMTCHIIYPAVDNMPAGLSVKWLNSILRKQLAFNGMIFSDDLNMAGSMMGSSPEQDVQKLLPVFAAGCNMVIISNGSDFYIDDIMDGLKDYGAQQHCETTSACWAAVSESLPANKESFADEYQAARSRLTAVFQ